MGMDVLGKNPRNKKGQYFRNNVWWWHPLWSYCCEVSPEIAGKVKYGHSNDGDGLDGRDSEKLAKVLAKEIKLGRTDEYEKKYMRELDNLPDVQCELCKGEGRRKDATARKLYPATTKPKGCNGCSGTGKRRPFGTNYPFSTHNVREFARFLANCGGFKIC